MTATVSELYGVMPDIGGQRTGSQAAPRDMHNVTALTRVEPSVSYPPTLVPKSIVPRFWMVHDLAGGRIMVEPAIITHRLLQRAQCSLPRRRRRSSFTSCRRWIVAAKTETPEAKSQEYKTNPSHMVHVS